METLKFKSKLKRKWTKKNLLTLKFSAIRFLFLFAVLVLTVVLFQSCQEKTPSKEVPNKQELSREELIAEVKQLYYNDQKYRRMLNVFEQLNSECKGGQVNLFNSKDDETKLAYSLFWKDVMDVIDEKNTKHLIEITERHGFPGMESLGHDIPVFLVFVHTPEQYYEEVRKLIEKEYKAGNVSEFERDYIFWHLNGRKRGTRPPGIPYPIYYRGGIEIFRGAIVNEMTGLFSSYDPDGTLYNETLIDKNLTQKELIATVRDLYFNDQKYRRIIGIFKKINNKCKGVEINPYNSEDDKTRLAYWLFRESVIEPQDRKNTKKLIALTKQYGFPGMERLGHDIPIYMVFAHTPYIFKYFDEVRKLVKQEYKAGRISEYAKEYIFWHLDGRMTGTPPQIPYPINYRTDIEILKGGLETGQKN